MLEARLKQAELLKKILDAIKELVTDANFDCSDEGIKLQAMDNSHVALVSLVLNAAGFEDGFRCDRNMSLGVNLQSLQKLMKCAGNDDVVTIRADDTSDLLALLFENKKQDRIAEYEMKLMDIDQEHLGIPDTLYEAEITLPSSEFNRIIRDLKELGESVRIEVSKDGIRFSCEGDIGSGAVTLKQTSEKAKEEDDDEDEDEKASDEEEADDDDDDVEVVEVKKEKKDKKNKMVVDDDEEEDEDEKPELGSDDEETTKPKRKASASASPQVKKVKVEKKPAKKSKSKVATKTKSKAKAKGKDDTPHRVVINMQSAVNLTFSIKYLSNFCKSTPLSDFVTLHMSSEVPLLVEYGFEQGHIRFYLAPKIADE